MADSRRQNLEPPGDDLPPEVKETLSAEVTDETEARLRGVLKRFRTDLAEHPYVRRPRRRGRPNGGTAGIFRRVVQPAALVAAIVACIVLATMLSVGPATPTWAQVAERFASVKTFSVTLYQRADALSDVKQVELWMASGGRVRAKTGSQVVFGLKGEVTKSFDVRRRKEVAADRMVQRLLRMLGDRETFSLDVVVGLFAGGELKDVTPQVNPGAGAGKDMVVYDMQSPQTPEWCRIWALRESLLPVRIQVWDPRDGEFTEVLLTYGPEPATGFFDADGFARRLGDRAVSDRTLSYLGLNDAVGKAFVPAAPQFARAFEVVTSTLDGKPWSLKDRMGKVTVLHVWDSSTRLSSFSSMYQSNLKELHAKFGGRDDFQIVSLLIATDVVAARKTVREKQIPWLCLYEDAKAWDGPLAAALGGARQTKIYLVDRQGQIRAMSMPACIERVKAEMMGLVYETVHTFLGKLSRQGPEGGLTTDEVRAMIGEPDEVTDSKTGSNHEQWTYVRKDERQEREWQLHVYIARASGRVIGRGSQHRILEPAKLTVTITPEFWKEKILPRIDPKYWPENDREDKYVLRLCARQIMAPQMWIALGDRWKDYKPGTAVDCETLHGSHEISVLVERREPFRSMQVTFAKSDHILNLKKNTKTEVTLE